MSLDRHFRFLAFLLNLDECWICSKRRLTEQGGVKGGRREGTGPPSGTDMRSKAQAQKMPEGRLLPEDRHHERGQGEAQAGEGHGRKEDMASRRRRSRRACNPSCPCRRLQIHGIRH